MLPRFSITGTCLAKFAPTVGVHVSTRDEEKKVVLLSGLAPTACATYQRVCPGGQDAWHHKEFASDIPQGAWPVQNKYVCQYSNFGGCCTAVACQMSMECCLLLEIVLHHENLLFLFESQAENPSALEIEHTSSAGHKI